MFVGRVGVFVWMLNATCPDGTVRGRYGDMSVNKRRVHDRGLALANCLPGPLAVWRVDSSYKEFLLFFCVFFGGERDILRYI